jgi:hypothetical protein
MRGFRKVKHSDFPRAVLGRVGVVWMSWMRADWPLKIETKLVIQSLRLNLELEHDQYASMPCDR